MKYMVKLLPPLAFLIGSLFCNAGVAADYTLQNNRWSLLTVPANSSAQTVEQIFGDDLPAATYDQEWVIYRFDSALQNYSKPTPQDTLPQGDGFWMIQLTGAEVTVDLPADLPVGSAEVSDVCASSAGCFSIPLPANTASASWSMLGAPYDTPIDVTQIRVSSSNGTCISGCDLAEAKAAGLLPTDPQIYNSSNGSYENLTSLSALSPWQGFWVPSSALSAETNPTLHLPKPAANPPPAQAVAFPGAAGYGANAKGGRGGAVIYVTNLNDSGEGSLRAALTAEGPRTVLFSVSGTIALDSEIKVENPYLTIAGQSAPGGGIAIRHSGVEGFTNALIHISTHDVIIRYIRMRRGPGGELECCGDNLLVSSSQDVIVDHTSMSWSTDEIMDVASSIRVTLQNNLFSEALRNSTHGENGEAQSHAFGPLLSTSSKQLTVYRNVFAHQTGRNPQFTPTDGGTFQVVNNMVHNTCYAMTFESRGPKANFNAVGNLITEGPLTCGLGRASIILENDVSVYVENNITPYRSEEDDEWLATAFFRVLPPADINLRSETPFEAPALETIKASQLENALLPDVGATLPERDVVDTRVLNLVSSREGSFIDDPGNAGGWPELRGDNSVVDSDLDGMDDSWEQLHDLNPSDPNDRNGDNDQDGYTNLEEFLNGTLPR